MTTIQDKSNEFVKKKKRKIKVMKIMTQKSNILCSFFLDELFLNMPTE
jgi:hypothetical protein